HYTGLEDLKIEMLAAAAADARQRADEILAAAGEAERGKLIDTHMGVININPANSSATSWEGNNDKSSLDKDIITIVHVTYQVDLSRPQRPTSHSALAGFAGAPWAVFTPPAA